MGRDPFEDDAEDATSGSVEKLIKGRLPGTPEAKEVSVNVKLTPSNIKHLDAVLRELARRGRKDVSRDDLIRIAIALLTPDDVG
jgi:hypothetical protein